MYVCYLKQWDCLDSSPQEKNWLEREFQELIPGHFSTEHLGSWEKASEEADQFYGGGRWNTTVGKWRSGRMGEGGAIGISQKIKVNSHLEWEILANIWSAGENDPTSYLEERAFYGEGGARSNSFEVGVCLASSGT